MAGLETRISVVGSDLLVHLCHYHCQALFLGYAKKVSLKGVIVFSLRTQRPQVQITALSRFIKHCLVSGQWQSNEPIQCKAGV